MSHEVVAHPVFHHVAPVVHHAPLAHHVAPVAHHVVDPVALTHGAVHQVTPFVDLGRKKREADAEVIISFKRRISKKCLSTTMFCNKTSREAYAEAIMIYVTCKDFKKAQSQQCFATNDYLG